MPYPLKTLTFDSNKIEADISNGQHERAALEIFEILEKEKEKEIIYKCLNLLNLICDKSPSISLRTIRDIKKFVLDSDSWIRLVSIEILYQISLYRPNLLIDLIENIRVRIFDKDASVRRIAVKLMGNLILSLYINVNELLEEYTERLMDDDWGVKLHVIKTIKKILNQDYTKIRDLEPLLSMVIVSLRDEDDDVARAAADLLKVLCTYFLSKEKTFYILLNLLYNEKPRVKELIIWLFGEIGKEKSSEIIPFIPKLIKLLRNNDYKVQLKIIDTIVNIAENNFEQIFSNLINSLDTSDYDFRDNIINSLYALGQRNISSILFYIFDELENPSKHIRESIALIFKRLYEEYPIEIENEISKIIYNLESKYWRERKNTILLLQNICFILKNEKLAVWISIILNKTLKIELDSDIKNEISFMLNKIESNFNEIDKKILKTKYYLFFINKKINEFQKLPAQFRKRLNAHVKNSKFDDIEIHLNKEYNKVLRKINKFNNILNNFEYKRLAFDLIEEWEDTKSQILDELSIIKDFIFQIFSDKKKEFLSELKEKIVTISGRIDVLRAQFEYIKNYSLFSKIKEDLLKNVIHNEELEETFENLIQLRRNLFNLDVDIKELLIHNIDVNNIFDEILNKWVNTKSEIRDFLNILDSKFKEFKEKILSDYFKEGKEKELLENINGINNNLAFQLLLGHVQSVISQGIDVFKRFNDIFDDFNSKLNGLIKKKEFINAKKLLEMKTTQIQTFISETEHEIDNIIGKESTIESDKNVFNTYVRPYLNKWYSSKEILINKLNYYNRKFNEKIYLFQIKYYLKIVNPIKLDLLTSYIGLDKDQLNQLILKFFSKNKLNAKIVNNYLYSQKIETFTHNNTNLLFFKNIKTISNKIYLNFKLNNPTNYDFKDIQIALKVPAYLKFIRKESFPKFLYLAEIKSGNAVKFNYVLKIDKENLNNKNLSDPSVDEIKLNLYYKDTFDIPRKTTKKISVLTDLI